MKAIVAAMGVLTVLCGPAICEPFQLMDADLRAKYVAALPETKDPTAREIFDNERTIWYRNQELPAVHQGSYFPSNRRFGGQPEALQGVFRFDENTAGVNLHPEGHPNNEHPWSVGIPGGTDNANIKGLVGLLLPAAPTDVRPKGFWPIVYFDSTKDGKRVFPRRWMYPKDTITSEVQWQVIDRLWYPHESRFRIRELDDWNVERLLPYQDRAHLVKLVASHDPGLAERIPTMPVDREIIESRHPRNKFRREVWTQELPRFPKSVVKAILMGEHHAVSGNEYAKGIDGPVCRSSPHIRPVGDQSAVVGIADRAACNQCHSDIGRHSRTFHPDEEWYKTVRGSDNLFSFHPLSGARDGSINKAMLEAGIVEKYDPTRHPAEIYQQSKALLEEIRRGVN